MFCDYEGHGFATNYAMSVESAEFYRVYYSSPVKNLFLCQNTGANPLILERFRFVF